MQGIYIDNAATTKVRQEVLESMNECNQYYGNPSCSHTMGQKSRKLIDNARIKIANTIDAKPNEIIFTSGGSESNNLAIQGIIDISRNNHIITVATEHMSVLNTIKHLYDNGCDMTVLPVDDKGLINLKQLQNSIRRNTALISVMFANNEIGTIQPIKEIGHIAKQYNIYFHTDAVQAFGHCDINVNELNIDMMSISGHKIYAPKGVGVLYVKNDIELYPLIHGGIQEFGIRAGTENVTSIVGMGKAVELLHEENQIKALKDKLIDGIKSEISGVKFNSPSENSLPNIVNVSFEDVDGKKLITMLSSMGIYASNSEVCMYSHSKPSHVLTAIDAPNNLAYGSVRFSLGKYNTENDINYILNILPDLIDKIRKGL